MVSQLLVGRAGQDNEVHPTNYHLLGELALGELLVEHQFEPGLVHHQGLPAQLSLALLLRRLHGQTAGQAVGGLREEEDDVHLLLLLLLLGGQAGAAPAEDWGVGVGGGDVVVMTTGTSVQSLRRPLLLTLILPATLCQSFYDR